MFQSLSSSAALEARSSLQDFTADEHARHQGQRRLLYSVVPAGIVSILILFNPLGYTNTESRIMRGRRWTSSLAPRSSSECAATKNSVCGVMARVERS